MVDLVIPEEVSHWMMPPDVEWKELLRGTRAVLLRVLGEVKVETGRGKPKAKTVLPSFCPFCGQKLEKS